MKIPTTFGWLFAAVLTATLLLFSATKLAGFASAGQPTPAPHPVIAPIGYAQGPPATAPSAAAAPRVQIAFLLDTSSSMDGLIDQAKARLWNILNEILKVEKDGLAPEIEVALYHYGNTALLPEKGYIDQLIPLSTDVDAFSEKLFALQTSGGDEYCGHVVLRATDELKWDTDDATVKLIYIAGNESFNQGEVQPIDALRKATDKGITVHTILCGDPNSPDGTTWRAGARAGEGGFFYINQDEKVVFVPSPYDREIENCNLRLNNTYVPVGLQGASLKQNQVLQDANAQSYSSANLSSRAKYKASKNYKNSGWDLVDAYEEKEEEILEQKATLPDSLATLPDAELKKKIAAISSERAALKERILELTRQRDAFVAEEKRNNAENEKETLGSRITGSVRKRLVKEGYKIKE